MNSFRIILFLLLSVPVFGQSVTLLESGQNTSIRGLSVVNDQVIWVSGSNGTVGKSLDGGNTWQWMKVKGFEKTDFRDIEAFNEKTAVIMGISEPAFILKTFNGGENWKLVYSDSTKGVFLDAMEFWDDYHGMAVGDPVDGKIYITQTVDNGNRWKRFPTDKIQKPEEGEAFFASSGTNIRRLNPDQAVIVSGGKRSRLLIAGRWYDIPVVQGTESTGANSVAVWYNRMKTMKIVVVGGDFKNDTVRSGNCYYTTDMARTWKAPKEAPHGYRSCVEFIDRNTLITCGTSGVDLSLDGGDTWKLISNESYHVTRRAKRGKAVFLAGANGRIGKLEIKKSKVKS